MSVVCVVSMGVCTCSGNRVSEAFECAKGETSDFFAPISTFASPRHQQKNVGVAIGFDSSKNSKLSHCGKILFDAINSALTDINLSLVSSDRISVYFGTSIGGIFEAENMLAKNFENPDLAQWLQLRNYECSTIAEFIAKRYGLRGECATYSTACSSSSLAVSDACNAIVQGDCDVAIVCGADAISRMTVNGFGSLLLLSQGRAKPFDTNRDGINLGEAGAVLILASESVAQKISNKLPLAYVSGWACSADAYHSTAPHPQGEGAARVMKNSIALSNLRPQDISFYCAHGTGTKGNDSSEFIAMQNVFETLPLYASAKRAFGHTLGASGVLNGILAIESIRRGECIANLGFENGGDEISVAPVCESKKIDIKNVLSVSLGFGGNNSATVFSKEKQTSLEMKKRKLFIYSCGCIAPYVDGNNIVELTSLLTDISPLKKRRWAKMQQMALDCAKHSLKDININVPSERIGVCIGTGMGMVDESRRFIEATILKHEAEPLPSAFTNSVHNATSSAVSLMFGFKGLNSAATAKEVSFEAALKQAWREINSNSIDLAFVGACDEYSEYAEKFLKHNAKFTNTQLSDVVDFSCGYILGVDNTVENAPVAEILDLKISRRKCTSSEELDTVKEFIKNVSETEESLDASKIDVFACVCPNSWQENFVYNVLAHIGFKSVCKIPSKYGRNYSVSAASFKEAIDMSISNGKKSNYAFTYTISSTGLRAMCLIKIL